MGVILLLDLNDLLEVIKKTAVKAVEAGKPCDYYFGKVTSKSPLKISIEQKIILDNSQLILTRNVTNYKTKVTIDGEETEITIQNALSVGEQVVLLRQKGGQKFLILDRVVNS